MALLGDTRLHTEPRTWVGRPRALPGGLSYSVDAEDDATRILSVHLAPVQYAGADGIVAIARDTTQEHHRIEELTSFAAVAAHDLKTPLTAVMGWLEVAEDQLATDPDGAAEAVRRGLLATQRMTAEIEDWLAYAVAREGARSPETIALAPLLADLAATYDAATLRLRAEDSVVADRTLLRHLLANLVGNASKYTRPGERPDVTVTSGPTSGRGGCGCRSSTAASASPRARRRRSSSPSVAPRPSTASTRAPASASPCASGSCAATAAASPPGATTTAPAPR